LHLKLVDYQRFPYSPGLRNKLLGGLRTGRDLGVLNFELGEKLAAAALDLVGMAREQLCDVDFVSLGGHTIAHVPPRPGNGLIAGLQIGEPAVVAERVELPVVSDFQARDVAAGGQGNPLAAYADWVLFSRDDRTVACLHLGHFASLSVIPPNYESVVAFETGPANAVIDGTVRFLTSGARERDDAGAAAAKGVVIDEFLEYLLGHPFFAQVPPKSIAQDEFAPDVYLRDALTGRKDHSLEDLVATVTAAVGNSIIRAYSRFLMPRFEIDRLIVTGGGAANRTLMGHIRKGMAGTVVRISDDYNLPHDAYDACALAILGSETIAGKAANVPHATGARRAVVLGKISLG
jgi:anhydro-N-acetylmuramic acid kinase